MNVPRSPTQPPLPLDEDESRQGWHRLALGQIAPLQRGFDLKPSLLRAGDYPVVYSNGILNYHDTAMVKAPGVVTGRSGTLGSVHYLEKDFWPHNTSLWVTDFKGNSPKFIYHLYSFLGLTRFASAAGIPTLNRNDVHSFVVTLPSGIGEQERIAEALSDADVLIGSLEQLITKKRLIRQATIQALVSGDERLPGFNRRWESSSLKEVCRGIVGGTHFTPRYVSAGIPFYSVENVTADNFVETKFISPEEHRRLVRACKPERGDILLTRIASLGETRLIDWDVEASIYGSLALLKCGDAVDHRFLYAYTKGDQFRKEIDERSLSNASPRKINMADIGRVRVEIPEREEQLAIVEVLEVMNADIAACEQRLLKMMNIKKAMAETLLTGMRRLV